MTKAYALTEETYDRFNRAASRVLDTTGGGGPLMPRRIDGREVLKVTSSTIGTYGYPAKLQKFNNTTGAYADDPDRPQTIYLIDPAGGAYTSGQYADAVFAGYRGAADNSVYEAVKPSVGDASYTVSGIANLSNQWLGAGRKQFDSIGIGYNSGAPTVPRINAAALSDGYLSVTGNVGGLPAGAIRTGTLAMFDSGGSGNIGAITTYRRGTTGSFYGLQFINDYSISPVNLFWSWYAGGVGILAAQQFAWYDGGATHHTGVFDITGGSTYGGLIIRGGIITGGSNTPAWSSIVGKPAFPSNNFAASTTPGASNDNTQGYSVGSTWVRTTGGSESVWVCCNAATGAAVWKQTG